MSPHYYTLSFKPLEPLLFRGPGEFDLSARGTYSAATSILIPTPTTLLGATLSTLIEESSKAKLDKLNKQKLIMNPWADMQKAIEETIPGIISIAVYLRRNGEIYIPFLGEIVPLNSIRTLIGKVESVLSGRIGYHDLVEQVRSFSMKDEFKLVERVGIGLNVRNRELGSKTAAEHRIYSVYLVAYPPNTEIVLELETKGAIQSLEKLRNTEMPVRLGGEGRAARLQVKSSWSLISRSGNLGFGVNLTHMLIRDWLGDLGEWGLDLIAGEITSFGGGFSGIFGIRRPIFRAIPPGSLFKLNKGVLQEILKNDKTGRANRSSNLTIKGLEGSEVGYNFLLQI